jgi:predicted alpha/beta hydrolase family esterase
MARTIDRVRVLILHGWQGSGEGHWQRWLAARLRDDGHHVQLPELPDCDVPCPDRWGAVFRSELGRLAARPDDERIVIAHSLGCLLWLREAAAIAPSRRVDRVALVAPPGPRAGIDALAGFYPTGAQRAAVAAAGGHTRLVCSDDDPYCPGGAAGVWGEPLGLEVDLVPGGGHLNVDAGFGPWPEMQAWCAGTRLSPAPAPQAGAKNGAEM